MSQSTGKRELLQLQTNVEENNLQSSNQLVERIEVENSPFVIIKQENKYFLTMGINKISPDFENESEVRTFITDNTWNIVLTLATIVYEAFSKQNLTKQ